VGNVLNSVNVSATIVADRLRESRVGKIGELVETLQNHQGDLGDFLSNDPRGQRMLPYMSNLSHHLELEHEQLGKEVASLAQHVSHIKEIVAMQQTYARTSGCYEKLSPAELLEDVLGIVRPGLKRHNIALDIDREELPPITTDRHKVLQILMNLLRNAKDALTMSGNPHRQIAIGMKRAGEDRIAIRVADNGVGIPPANLLRIFSHGFTTKKDGHGFGLHSSALAAKQLRGSLTVESVGANAGAVFTLELPFRIDVVAEEEIAT
jgi:C4-dicarboxylate-specific signal transduction histidine kinase